ncbi:MAG: DUF1611 domain-containing protein [Candidatus Marinimicrobia bacterium]|jgi:uncharacterized NAD-dependent epimerase/dehydratase family protein|nr:DUF1611 domain-containing protein [Candidatus Neomarinimicrobiota bacterium]MBT3574567.1 DUF1611 domain-containing protein [Candidatus Neomarinimicrobiota bacterium]MBT3680465.1 DUF1611 domain-containing protein [Candidatus Neomarinimicrobiota bacterium]MBT3951201.1 DUF1611 domain-containing protein [Candidatus Neomarinimicrobiota bacterium]MBT4253030.1 DUF1611 domain-containing protein [Candidatus Neomarinimicrobiota bacterium]
MDQKRRRFVLYAQNRLHALGSKTANGLILFRQEEVQVVVDASKAGMTVQDVLGYGGDIPIVAHITEAMAFQPDTLVIGVAPIGGAVKPEWIPELKIALEAGLNVWAGLHQFLGDVDELKSYRNLIWDARRPPPGLKVAQGHWRERKSKIILTIGSDSNVGKMTTALMLQRQLKTLGLESIFVGTGQTGMMISGRGVAVDAIVSDFVNGATEAEIDKVDGQAPLIIVEGQGAVTHIGYSAVTMGLIHGSMPDAFVLAHQPSRIVDDYDHPLPEIQEVIDIHTALMRPFKSTKVLGINLYSKDLSPDEGQKACENIYENTGLPVEDMVKSPKGIVAEKVLRDLFPEKNV